MISVYKRLGHETSFVGAWTGDAFFLATILFVDDSDLLNMDIGTSTDEMFLKTVQEAILDWGGLGWTCSSNRRVTQILKVLLVYDVMVLGAMSTMLKIYLEATGGPSQDSSAR